MINSKNIFLIISEKIEVIELIDLIGKMLGSIGARELREANIIVVKGGK